MIFNLCPQIHIHYHHYPKQSSNHSKCQHNLPSHLQNTPTKPKSLGISVTLHKSIDKLKQKHNTFRNAVSNRIEENLKKNQRQLNLVDLKKNNNYIKSNHGDQLWSQRSSICKKMITGLDVTSKPSKRYSLRQNNYYSSTSEFDTNTTQFTKSRQGAIIRSNGTFQINQNIQKKEQEIKPFFKNKSFKLNTDENILKTIQSVDSQLIITGNNVSSIVNKKKNLQESIITQNIKYRYDESIIQRKSILQNFCIIKVSNTHFQRTQKFRKQQSQYIGLEKKLNFLVIIKTINKKNLIEISQQISIQNSCASHPNLLKLYQTVVDNQNYVFLYEYYQHTLSDLIGKISENKLKNYILQIINGLIYLHMNRITYGKYNCDNIKIVNGICKLGDFCKTTGLNQAKHKKNIKQRIKTQLVQIQTTDQKQDFIKLGLIICEILRIGVKKKSNKRILNNNKNFELFGINQKDDNKNSMISNELLNFLNVIFQKRYKCVQELINHKWLNQNKSSIIISSNNGIKSDSSQY